MYIMSTSAMPFSRFSDSLIITPDSFKKVKYESGSFNSLGEIKFIFTPLYSNELSEKITPSNSWRCTHL